MLFLALVQANANRNFDETIEAHVRLGIDRRRSDMVLANLSKVFFNIISDIMYHGMEYD